MNKFPNDPIFVNLLRLRQSVQGVLIHDEYGIDASPTDLINDVTRLRETLRRDLPADWYDAKGLLRPNTGCIATISPSGYYFLVAFFAIAALGGTCVALPTKATPDVTLKLLASANVSYILAEPNTIQQATDIKEQADNNIKIIQIERAAGCEFTFDSRAEIDESLSIDASQPCMVTHTSGSSTGQPKCVVIPRRTFFFSGQADPDRVFLAFRPVHWMGGASGLLARVLRGTRIHWPQRSFDPAMFWEIFKQGTITDVSFSSSLFKELEDYYLLNICGLPADEREAYISGVGKIRDATISGSAMNPATAQFWIELTGMNIRNVYGSSELGGLALASGIGAQYVDRCIGTPTPGAQIKLSNGDEGELLVKSPRMFTHYLNDEAATKKAFDEDGFYKTGDLVRRVGGYYFFEGRVDSDWINFLDCKISVLELEEHLLRLSYISEAHILPVLDHETRGVAAALVRLNCGDSDINLQRVRDDLSLGLERYKLPALLYILKAEEEVPRAASDKVLKTQALDKFFRIRGYRPRDYHVDGVECLSNSELVK
ncbi:acetyl-CoA synthetase-like protein [Penicillium angulare]|uniref:Acetyl-CoA synthetase-like protein n=1 Tax=Penicillium angulare TaxID=116970 RepID=A0A9W9G6J0_9EURO|nr:acetyl-CoA synthetase-like protein [Penicillium angulare]